jgi:uncharacterized membrane protein (DUF106 family)
MTFLDPFFDKAFGFMLNWPPFWAILVLSLIISLIIVLIYKWMTDQNEMKRLKDELSSHQKKMKELKGNPEKLMKAQKEAMSVNMQYMSKSMKPTLITFLPIILIFGWMNGHFAYEPLAPNEEFSLTVNFEKEISGNASITVPEGLEIVGESTKEIEEKAAVFKLKGTEGEYYATITSNGQEIDKKITITTERKYAPVLETYKSDVFKTAQLGNKTLKVFWKINWFWAYIIFAIVFSMALRKMMKIY